VSFVTLYIIEFVSHIYKTIKHFLHILNQVSGLDPWIAMHLQMSVLNEINKFQSNLSEKKVVKPFSK